MSSEANHGRRFQFSLKAMFVLLTAVAVALEAFRTGSVFWFLVLLAETVAGIGVAAYRVFAREKHWRIFYAVAAIVGCVGIYSAFSGTAWHTPLIQFAWEDLTSTERRWFDFGLSFYMSMALIATWIAALALGTIAEFLWFLGRKLRHLD
jgi:hypothetical protein